MKTGRIKTLFVLTLIIFGLFSYGLRLLIKKSSGEFLHERRYDQGSILQIDRCKSSRELGKCRVTTDRYVLSDEEVKYYPRYPEVGDRLFKVIYSYAHSTQYAMCLNDECSVYKKVWTR